MGIIIPAGLATSTGMAWLLKAERSHAEWASPTGTEVCHALFFPPSSYPRLVKNSDLVHVYSFGQEGQICSDSHDILSVLVRPKLTGAPGHSEK